MKFDDDGFVFQSLFYWIFLSEKIGQPKAPYWCFVSILVLLDFPFGDKDTVRRGCHGRSFNPCSIGFSFRRLHSLPLCLCVHYVSILVLLDFPFGGAETGPGLFRCFCFNPCSIGFSFRRIAVLVISVDGGLFQSLFYWIFLSERSRPRLVSMEGIVSILVLLDFPFGVSQPSKRQKNMPSFNPCSIGFSFRR